MILVIYMVFPVFCKFDDSIKFRSFDNFTKKLGRLNNDMTKESIAKLECIL